MGEEDEADRNRGGTALGNGQAWSSDHTKTSWLSYRDADCSEWYEHVSRLSGLAKTILESTVKGVRRPGKQKKGGKTTSGNGQPGVHQVPEGSGEQNNE